MKKLTIAIPNFNGGMNLQRAIESCRSIDLPENDFEILIVDNCSTDNSIDVINESKMKISNIRLVKNQENVGRIGNWNICLREAQGEFLIFLFTNDFINDENNIKNVIDVLESDETISLAISPLVKKLKNVNILKKRFFDETIKCLSKKYSVECLQRGFLPFGPIQSVIYRMEDIQKLEYIFEPDLPIDADDLFSFNMALNRKYILFNIKPQITWDLTSGRFHASWTVIEEFNEQTKTIDALENKIKLEINYGLLSTYRLIHLLKYQNFNSSKEESFSKIFSYIVSFMNKKSTFFKIDKIFFIGLVNKIFNKKTEADDILHKLIIKKSLE